MLQVVVLVPPSTPSPVSTIVISLPTVVVLGGTKSPFLILTPTRIFPVPKSGCSFAAGAVLVGLAAGWPFLAPGAAAPAFASPIGAVRPGAGCVDGSGVAVLAVFVPDGAGAACAPPAAANAAAKPATPATPTAPMRRLVFEGWVGRR